MTNETVTYRGLDTTIRFKTANYERAIHSTDSNGKPTHTTGTVDFIINGKAYPVTFEMRVENKNHTAYTINGLTCPDNEKRIIEQILLKRGI